MIHWQLYQKMTIKNEPTDFVVPADHLVKLKESKKRDKYQDLSREQKKLWNMKMTVIPVVIRELGTIPKNW